MEATLTLNSYILRYVYYTINDFLSNIKIPMLLTIKPNELEKTSDWLLIEISMLLIILCYQTSKENHLNFKVIFGFRISIALTIYTVVLNTKKAKNKKQIKDQCSSILVFA